MAGATTSATNQAFRQVTKGDHWLFLIAGPLRDALCETVYSVLCFCLNY